MNQKVYQTTLQLPFRYCDSAGIMFFANIYDLAHDAIENYVQSIGISWDDWFNDPNYGAPIRHAESDYHRPLVGGEHYIVEAQILETSKSSLTFQISFLKEKTLHASVKIIAVFIDKKARTKIEIPEKFRSLILSQVSEL